MTVEPRIVVVEPFADPTVMFVVEPLRPPVPMLTVLVLPVVVAPEPKPCVPVPVLEPNVLVLAEKVLPAVKV